MPKTIRILIFWHSVSLATSSALQIFYQLTGSERYNIYILIAFYLFGAAMFPFLNLGIDRVKAFLLTLILSVVVTGCIWLLFRS